MDEANESSLVKDDSPVLTLAEEVQGKDDSPDITLDDVLRDNEFALAEVLTEDESPTDLALAEVQMKDDSPVFTLAEVQRKDDSPEFVLTDALMEDDSPEFTLTEIMKMEKKFKKMGETSLSWEFCNKLATKFSRSFQQSERSSITWEHVHNWFQDRYDREVAKSISLPEMLKALADPSQQSNETQVEKSLLLVDELRTSYIEPESYQKSREESITELKELRFEARSSKDYAWFDVSAFLNYRVVCSGELEVRVRFGGFGNEEDEWVNVKRAVRQRSIPLEASECHRVEVGDLVLCYRENDDHALYCDAHIVDIERRLHDIKGCRCIFVVRFDHDYLEDKVLLSRMCCRPA